MSFDYDYDTHSRGNVRAFDDFDNGFDYRLTDEFDDEPQAFRNGYRQGWTAAVEADVQSRYPGYDNPHSTPPDWFDPAIAGETW